MAPALEIMLWLIFASISIGGIGLAALLIWVTLRAIVQGFTGNRGAIAVPPIPLSTFGSATVHNSIGIVGTIWLTLLVLVPVLVLALWQFAVELERGQIGASLALAIVHLLLIWALMQLGTRVQRKVDLSTTGLVMHPVIGPRRELFWSGIVRIDDVSYVGPGVSGLYLYELDGPAAVLDIWLPQWQSLRVAVRERVPHATWNHSRRGWLVG